MEEHIKVYSTAAELFKAWTCQPFGECPDTHPENLFDDLDTAFLHFSQGKQFVYVYDYQLGKVAFVSRNIHAVLGYATEDVCPEFFYRIMHPADHDQVLRISRASGDLVLLHKEIEPLTAFLTVDCRLRHAGGHYIKMQRQSCVLKRDDMGNIRYSLGIFTDIEHLHRGEEVSFDVSIPEYKVLLKEILASYEPGQAQGEFSVREKQVLGLMALGKNTRQIALELSLSAFTVDTHRKNMKKKLKARNTAQLITSAFARKLI